MLDNVDPSLEYIRLVLGQEEVVTAIVVLRLYLVYMLQKVAILFFELHHGICELFVNFRQRE